VRRTGVVVVAASLVLTCSAGASPRWDVSGAISTGDRAVAAELAMNAAGDAIAVWDEEVGADCANAPAALSCVHILDAAVRARGSSAWGAPGEITRPGVGAAPEVAINAAGDAAIAWIHDIGRDRVLQASIRRGVSGRWPNANDLSDSVLEIRNERIGLDDGGDAVAVWAQRVETAFVVHAEVRPAAVGVWSSATRLSSPGADASGGPVLALTSAGRAYVAWIEAGVVRVASGDIRTGVWDPAVTISPSAAAEGEPALAVNAAGDAVAAWPARTSGGTSVVQVASYRPSTGWTPAGDLGGAATPGEPQVALDAAGLAVVVWRGEGEGAPRAASQVAGGAWSRSVAIASGGGDEPRVAVAPGGNAVAVWTQDGVAEAALRPAASGEWLPAAEIAESDASGPRISVDSGNGVVVVWIRQASGRLVLEGTQLVGDGPFLDHLRIPKSGRARTRLSFGVEAVPWQAPLTGRPSWRFGDGVSATGAHVRHTYRKAGRYLVSVAQPDASGGTATATATIVVKRQRRVHRPQARMHAAR
jgi:PKD domain